MALFATVFPLICWFAYNHGAFLIERRYSSLSTIMSLQRRRWVANASRRETPSNAILAGNIMGSVSFLASTSALLVLATFATFGQLDGIAHMVSSLPLSASYAGGDIELQIVALLAMFVISFFAFTLSLRQFNHFCIMLGALDLAGNSPEDEIDAIAQLNTLAAENFNRGLRALYFCVPMIAWFVSPWLSVGLSLLTVGLIVHREFFSSAHRLAASVAVSAGRAEAGGIS